MKRRILMVCLFLFAAGVVHGQDPHFSQFAQQRQWLSPARVGDSDADLRLSAFHRRQWASVTVPFQTFSLGAEGKLSPLTPALNNFNAGVFILQDKAGDGVLSTLNAAFAVSYTVPVLKDSAGFLRFGINIGFRQRSIDPNKLHYAADYINDAFVAYPTDYQDYDRTGFVQPDLGAGISWTGFYSGKRLDAAFGLQHLTQPDQHFLPDEKVPLPLLMTVQSELSMPVTESSFLYPSAIFLAQKSYHEITAGAEYQLLLRKDVPHFSAVGFMLDVRLKDAIIPGVSLYWKKWRLGFTYDINTSGLRKASRGLGGPEFSLIYKASAIRANVKHPRLCPIY